MSYVLDGTTIKSPNSFNERNSTQQAVLRSLSGTISKDLFGSNKRVWSLSYDKTKKADYDTINTIYQSYLSTGTAKSWQVTESNYNVSSTTVHLDLVERSFNTKGSSYISGFDLVLTEE